jgi:glycosyltransferase involved in cell wall biosynthesis
MGRRAADWVAKNRNIWTAGPAVLEAVEQYVKPPRVLKRSYTFVVPTWETPCGIAEYTRHICENIPGVKATAGEPDRKHTRLLHFQHEPSLFIDAELTIQVQKARAHRVPVVITEHHVQRDGPAWEREADALVALTAAGTKMLQERWPKKRVAQISCGCPTWFPERKKKRGRVIGAFGFLEPHKGFWRLLEVLKELPDTELLLVSHARHAENVQRWISDAAGLPVRHYKEFMPEAEAARLLAAEADMLAYWYDDNTQTAASAAVRVGLATGVPVLASPTGWFTDLRDVTFQPPDLIEGVRQLLEDTSLRDRLTSAARDYCHEHSWPSIAERHLALWQSLEAND